jgi:hypothetical protein
MSEERKKYADDSALRELQLKIREQMDRISNEVLEGVCEDYSHYRWITGIIAGLADAEAHLLDIDERLTED